jgi:hypothetical protein
VVWHSGFQRRFMEPMLRLASKGQPLPAILRDPRVSRAWNSIVVLLLFLLWWFLGTPAAMRLLGRR